MCNMKKVFLLIIILSLNTFAQKKQTSSKSKFDLIVVRDQSGLIGFINSEGKEIVPPKYNMIYPFGKDIKNWARVASTNNLIGFINSEGKEIVPPKYAMIYPFGQDKKNWARVIDIFGLIGYINSDGTEIVKPKYTCIDFSPL
jgi:hypothetical protein